MRNCAPGFSRRAGVATILVGTVVGVCGCTGSLFASKVTPPTVYQLSTGAVSAAAARAVLPADVAVQRPRVRVGLNTDRIAILYPDGRLDSFAAARWSGPLDEVTQDLAVESLMALPIRTVSSDSSGLQSGYWLEIDVADFQAEYPASSAPPDVHVHLVARLGRTSDLSILGSFDADVRQGAADNRLTAIVKAFDDAAGAALEEVGTGVTKSLGQILETR